MLNFTNSSGKVFIASILVSALTTGCVSTPPAHNETIEEVAFRQYKTQNWEGATKAYTQLILQNGETYNILYNRGYCLKKLGRYKEAIIDFEKANSIRPNDQGASLFEVSVLASKVEDYRKVIESTEKLLKREQRTADATILRKQALFARVKNEFQSLNYTVALADAEKLIEINPDEISYKVIKARCLYELGSSIESREKTEDYMKLLEAKLEVGSYLSSQTTKMRAINLFYMRTPQAARKAKLMFDQYLDSVKEKGLTKENAFWAGLIAKINLDSETQSRYWSCLGKSYIAKMIKEIKK